MTCQKNTVIITGVEGQDGSTLADFLLKKNYQVIGVTRRSGTKDLSTNINAARTHENFKIELGDISDHSFINFLITKYRPEMYFNLAAMSHVGQSFREPLKCFDNNARAVVIALDAIKNNSPETRFYQASTSEMYGGMSVPPTGYTEASLFHPRSPYAVAKVAAHYSVQNYREAYHLYACSGVLFNHSCISKETALLIKRNKNIEIVSPEDLLSGSSCLEIGKDISNENISIWDGDEWVELKAITVKPIEKENRDFQGMFINTRSGVICTTNNHNLLDKDGWKKRADSFSKGEELLHGNFPENHRDLDFFTEEEAKLIGLIVGDGWVHKEKMICHIGNNCDDIVSLVKEIWSTITGGSVTIGKFYRKKQNKGKSRKILLNNFVDWEHSPFLRQMIYNGNSKKKVPVQILNASKEVQAAFLEGYNLADGLKKNKCTYLFKNFKTNSQELAAGLLFLINKITEQEYNITVEENRGNYYYSINLLSNRKSSKEKIEIAEGLLSEKIPMREIHRRTEISRSFIQKVARDIPIKTKHYGFQSRKEIKKIINTSFDYVYDIETASGKFMAGAGRIVIANSPRRGFDFATRKITRGVASVKLGLSEHIYMGNLSAFRDEGSSNDYVQAMYLMLAQNRPEDYVIATGSGATIEEMFRHVCGLAELNFEDIYRMDKRFMRPSDVPYLKGNPAKAKKDLNWKPKYTWKRLLKEMYEHDLRELSAEKTS